MTVASNKRFGMNDAVKLGSNPSRVDQGYLKLSEWDQIQQKSHSKQGVGSP